MYFAIVGRHPKLSLAEFALVETTSLRRQGEFLFFESDLDEGALLSTLEKLWGIVKRGKVIKKPDPKNQIPDEKDQDIASFLEGVTIIGVNEQKLGMEVKKLYGVRRFKIVELTSSDLEIKKDGKELISLGGGQIGLVLGWQDIAHFELIDFGKPAHGMEVGMMPGKLAQMLVNIGITEIWNLKSESWKKDISLQNSKIKSQESYTVYDPFCWFGTTGFVANRVGHHFVGSDISITGARENAKRWEEERSATNEEKLHYTVFKHDVTEPFDHPVVKKVDVIVTEGWLGPVVSRKTREPELLVHAEKIKELYATFLNNIHAIIPHVPLVLTLPSYTRLPDAIFPEVIAHAVWLWYAIEDLGIYSRKGQEVCRQIVVLTK
jgi:hypothetical protein